MWKSLIAILILTFCYIVLVISSYKLELNRDLSKTEISAIITACTLQLLFGIVAIAGTIYIKELIFN